MTNSQTPTPESCAVVLPDTAEAARARVAQIAQLFTEMHALMKQWCHAEDVGSKATGQKMISKMNDLQIVHLMLLRAEEVFHDKCSQADDSRPDARDYDAIRREIGSALDRIRDTIVAAGVSGGAG